MSQANPSQPAIHDVLVKVRQTMTPENTCRGAEWEDYPGQPTPAKWHFNQNKSFHQHICQACADVPGKTLTCNQLYQGCLEALHLAMPSMGWTSSSNALLSVLDLSHHAGFDFLDCQRILDRAIQATKPKPVLRKWLVTRTQVGEIHAETEEQARDKANSWTKYGLDVTAEEIL